MMGLAVVPGDAAERVLAAQLRSADHVALLRQAMNLFGLLFLWQVFGHHGRSEEHTSELQSLMRISYAVFCLKKKIIQGTTTHTSRSRHRAQPNRCNKVPTNS